MLINNVRVVFSAKDLLAALKNECRPMLHEASKIVHLEPSDSPLRFAHLPARGSQMTDRISVTYFQITICIVKSRGVRS